jgi:hypothetical protein
VLGGGRIADDVALDDRRDLRGGRPGLGGRRLDLGPGRLDLGGRRLDLGGGRFGGGRLDLGVRGLGRGRLGRGCLGDGRLLDRSLGGGSLGGEGSLAPGGALRGLDLLLELLGPRGAAELVEAGEEDVAVALRRVESAALRALGALALAAAAADGRGVRSVADDDRAGARGRLLDDHGPLAGAGARESLGRRRLGRRSIDGGSVGGRGGRVLDDRVGQGGRGLLGGRLAGRRLRLLVGGELGGRGGVGDRRVGGRRGLLARRLGHGDRLDRALLRGRAVALLLPGPLAILYSGGGLGRRGVGVGGVLGHGKGAGWGITQGSRNGRSDHCSSHENHRADRRRR